MSNWREVKLGELGEVNRGRSRHRPRNAPKLYGGPYPFVQTGDIKSSGGRITSHKQTYNEVGLAQSRLWPINTMVITIAANIAETAILTYPACFPDSVIGFIANESICDVRFVEYTFRLLRNKIQQENVGTGSVQDNINLQTLDELRFLLPPLSEQRAIAHVLGTLDDKIELNHQINETLESTARALFKSWFVDFDPVRAKMAGLDTGLPRHIADLFPDQLVDSELGKIPEGWEVKVVSDFASIKGGKQLPKDKFVDNGSVPVFGGAGLMGYTDDYNADGDVITVGRVGAYCGQFFSYQGRAWINNNASIIAQNEGISGEWLLLSLRNLDIDLIKKGAAQPFISNSDLGAMNLIAPVDSILETFRKFLESLFRRLAQAQNETKILTSLHDALLPKLVSGELQIKDAEAFLARVV